MLTTSEMIDTIETWSNREKTLAEFIATVYKDKYVEIYVGDAYEDIKFEQSSQNYPAVFSGKVISAYKECLVIEAIYVAKDKKVQKGALMCLNERAIRCLIELNGDFSIQDMMLRSNETSSIYNAYKYGKLFRTKK